MEEHEGGPCANPIAPNSIPQTNEQTNNQKKEKTPHTVDPGSETEKNER